MSFDRDTLLSLLPRLYHVRDLALAEADGHDRGPLTELLAIVAEQLGVVEEDLEQLYDDAFIETCAKWAVPYIGDLIGYRALHGVAPRVVSRRAEVAHTIAFRRRKGTATVLEQLARDVTGWPAHVVEFFHCLATTQYMNHLRPWVLASPDLRQWEPLERVGTAFDRTPRTVDVRRIASGSGRHNIPNVGVFLWRIAAYSSTRSPAARVDDRRYRFSPLNHDQPLFTLPDTEDDITQVSTPLNVPLPIGRRVLHERKADYYGDIDRPRSLRLFVGTSDPLPLIPLPDVRICDLSDDAGTWAHLPPSGQYAIDPVLGRIALPPGLPSGTRVHVDYHYGFSADLGGGEYERGETFGQGVPAIRVPDDHASIQAALNALGGAGIVEITDSGRYEETLSLSATPGKALVLRAANGCRPTVVLAGECTLAGGGDAEIDLDGILFTGQRLRVAAAGGNALRRLRLQHCTLVPGWSLAADGSPTFPGETSLIVDIPDVIVTVDRSILGAVRTNDAVECRLRDTILDAGARTAVAYSASDGVGAGGPLTLEACTVVGTIHSLELPLVSNSIVFAALEPGSTWPAPMIAVRRQKGCVRFSFVPATSRVPRRFRCVPGSDTSTTAAPQFTSLRYGHHAYAQLRVVSGPAILTGASDEGEMGAFHFLHQPQRATNIRVRLDEYLRVGLEAGIVYES